MQKKWAKFEVKGWFLLLLFCSTLVYRATHHLFLHHHEGHPVCEQTYSKDGSTHIHDERYQAEDCSICAFLFAVPEISALQFLPSFSPGIFEFDHFSPHSAPVLRVCETNFLRGPPTCMANF